MRRTSRGISHWLNTPGEPPLTLAALRGKVVLVDFWTYSCINCIRTLPHLRAWYAAYHTDGLEIVGVHTPEFAFEHVTSNVRHATHDLHVTWPVALDNGYKTWNAYSNEYWPAEYLVDRLGHVRRTHFGEGNTGTEQTIRRLLAENGSTVPGVRRTSSTSTPTEIVTPESYLGYARLDVDRYGGTPVALNVARTYAFADALPQNALVLRRGLEDRRPARTGGRRRAVAPALPRAQRLSRPRRQRQSADPPRREGAGSVRVDADRLYTLVSGRRCETRSSSFASLRA